MDRLDSVVGQANWQATYSHALSKTVCELSIRCGDEWIIKSNGAGDSDIEGEKGALSDAFKRAAVLWGIGRYLYNLDSPWVALVKGRAIKKDEMPRLQRLLGTDARDMPALNIVATSQYGDFVVEYENDDEFVDGVAGLIYSAKSTTDLEALYKANLARLKRCNTKNQKRGLFCTTISRTRNQSLAMERQRHEFSKQGNIDWQFRQRAGSTNHAEWREGLQSLRCDFTALERS